MKVLYVRNLMLSTTESTIEDVFSIQAPVERVKKIRDYAFVHFHSKEDAHNAMNALNGTEHTFICNHYYSAAALDNYTLCSVLIRYNFGWC